MDDFSASYDRTTKIVAGIACALLAIPAAAVHSIGIRIVSILVMLVSYAYSPRAYGFADGAVVVERLVSTARVAVESLEGVPAAAAHDLNVCVRFGGTGTLDIINPKEK